VFVTGSKSKGDFRGNSGRSPLPHFIAVFVNATKNEQLAKRKWYDLLLS
jgi:hypothetical protein